MITSITPEQEKMLEQVRDEWIAIGLSTEPANRAAAEEGVRMAYMAAGLVPPERMIWGDSPMAGVNLRAMLVLGYLEEGAGEPDEEKVRREKANYSQGLILGQHDAGFCSWIDAHKRLGVTGLGPFDGNMQVARNAGWWWAYDEAVIITDRPRKLVTDREGRLHCEDGKALEYRDGWGLHAWHGTRVPAGVIEDPVEAWTLERILRLSNTEVRRAAIERAGWGTLEAQLGEPVATAPDPGNPGRTIALYDVPENLYEARVRLVLMTNGSPDRSGAERRYGETVPAEVSDPVAAQAWAYGIPAASYAAAERRT